MRGKKAKQRPSKPDSMYNNLLVQRLINYVMKDGRRTVAEKIVYGAMDELAKQLKLNPLEAFEKAVEILKPKVEVRSRRVGGANYQVPVPVSEDRQQSLALRWLITAAKDSRGVKTYSHSLANELFLATKKEGTAYRKKEDTHKMAEANKAFSHLSW